jgi:hypothetical protein
MSLFGESSGGTVFLMVLVIGVVFMVLMKTRRAPTATTRPVRGAKSKTSTTAAKSTTGTNADAPQEVRRWEVEMHELARDLSAQLDSKMMALQHLLRQADERIAQLSALNRWPAQPMAPTGDDRHEWTGGRPAADQQRAGMSNAVGSTTHDSDRRYSNIYALADRGAAAAAIAEQTDTPIGEVELILGLRPRRDDSP